MESQFGMMEKSSRWTVMWLQNSVSILNVTALCAQLYIIYVIIIFKKQVNVHLFIKTVYRFQNHLIHLLLSSCDSKRFFWLSWLHFVVEKNIKKESYQVKELMELSSSMHIQKNQIQWHICVHSHIWKILSAGRPNFVMNRVE